MANASDVDPAPRDRPARGLALGLGLALVAATLGVFRGALDAGFTNWDDPLNVTSNPAFRGFTAEHLRWMWTTFHAGHWMPLTWTSLAIDHALWGLEPTGYHATNLALHALVALCVFGILSELAAHAVPRAVPRLRLGAAFVGALAFALHPLRAESVVWITERRDVLSSAFLCAAFLVWLRAARRAGAGPLPRAAWLTAVGLYALSLLSKSMGITLPVVLTWTALWLGRRAPGRRLALELAPFYALAAVVGAVALFGQAEGTDQLSDLAQFGWSKRLAASGYALAFYPWKTLWPTGLSPLYELDRDLDPTSATYLGPGVIVVLVTVALAVHAVRARRFGLLTAWLVYVTIALPLVGLVQTGRQLVADRYSYLACLPFASLVAVGLTAWARRLPLAVGALGLLALGIGPTARQVEVWHDSVALWSRAVAVDPTSATAHLNLGVARHQAGDPAAALDAYGVALAENDLPDAYYNRALSRLALGRTDDALADVLATLDRAPGHVPALEVLRALDRAAGRADRSIARLEAACALEPPRAGPRVLLAAVWRDLDRPTDARTRLLEAVAAEPDFAPAWHALGRFRLAAGEPDAAIAALERAVATDPFRARYRVDLGRALRGAGRADDARRAFEAALRFEPDDPAARAELERGP